MEPTKAEMAIAILQFCGWSDLFAASILCYRENASIDGEIDCQHCHKVSIIGRCSPRASMPMPCASDPGGQDGRFAPDILGDLNVMAQAEAILRGPEERLAKDAYYYRRWKEYQYLLMSRYGASATAMERAVVFCQIIKAMPDIGDRAAAIEAKVKEDMMNPVTAYAIGDDGERMPIPAKAPKGSFCPRCIVGATKPGARVAICANCGYVDAS